MANPPIRQDAQGFYVPIFWMVVAAVFRVKRIFMLFAAAGTCYLMTLLPWKTEAWPYLLVITVLWVHYWFKCCRGELIVGMNTPSKQRVLSMLKCLKQGYQPTPYMTNSDFQTLVGVFGRPWPGIKYQRERSKEVYHDGETAVFDWAFARAELADAAADDWRKIRQSFASPADYMKHGGSKTEVPRKTPVIVIFHGLTLIGGDLTIDHLVYRFNKQGWHCVVPIRRGCSDDPRDITVPKYYDYGGLDDSIDCVNYIAKKMPGHPLFGIGLSAGSNILCNYLSETGAQSKLLGGLSIANGFCYQSGSEALARDHPEWDMFLGSIAQFYLWRRHGIMHKDEAEAFHQRKTSWETSRMLNSAPETYIGKEKHEVAMPLSPNYHFKSLRDLDEHVTRKMHGYPTIEDFYNAQSCKPRLHKVQVPLVFLNARDDKFAGTKNWPLDTVEKNPNLSFIATQSGGHLGWHQGMFPHRKEASTFLDDFAVEGFQGLMLEARHRLCHPNENPNK